MTLKSADIESTHDIEIFVSSMAERNWALIIA